MPGQLVRLHQGDMCDGGGGGGAPQSPGNGNFVSQCVHLHVFIYALCCNYACSQKANLYAINRQ